ncbi:hypothetical protein [Lentilitoribacter sp. EG35]|uniref:hypothetical protein n=1 Tax=Lentilitoribacter sp. EG35 TaxID=3234192 RepID=UPI0034602422
MTDENSNGNKKAQPVERINDGSVNAKIWRNHSKDGKPFYNVTFARTYTHPQTGQPAETYAFSGTDVLKIQRLAEKAYHNVDRLKQQDRTHDQGQNQQQPPTQENGHNNMADQRDQAMNNASQQSNDQQSFQQNQGHQGHNQNGPEIGR